MFDHLLAAFAQHRKRDAKTHWPLRARDGLKQQIHWRAPRQRSKLRRNMRQAAGLRRSFASSHQTIQRVQNRANRFHRIRRGIHADDGVAASIQQSFKRGQQDAADIVHRMIRLHANPQHAALAHGVAAARHVANPRRGQHQILVAHNFRHGGGDFGNDGALDRAQFAFGGGIVEQALAEFANGDTFQRLEVFAIEGIQNQAAHVVLIRINQRILQNIVERQIRKLALCGNPFAFRSRGDSGQLIARLHLVRLGKKLTKIGKHESLGHKGASKKHHANFT